MLGTFYDQLDVLRSAAQADGDRILLVVDLKDINESLELIPDYCDVALSVVVDFFLVF